MIFCIDTPYYTTGKSIDHKIYLQNFALWSRNLGKIKTRGRQFCIPYWMVLAVAPGEGDHRGSDGEQLGRLHRGELKADRHFPVLKQGGRLGFFVKA